MWVRWKNSKHFCSKLLIGMHDGYKSRSLDWYNLTLCNSPIVYRFLPGNIISSNRVITEACKVGKTLQLSVKVDLGSTPSRVTVCDSIMPEMDQNEWDLATFTTQNKYGWICGWKTKQYFILRYGILLPKLFWPTVRKNCSSDR